MKENSPKNGPIRVPCVNVLSCLLLLLVNDVIGTSDDITNIWYYGCRWFGGSINMLRCNCTYDAPEMYIQKNTIPTFDTSIIEISNCPAVRFGPYSLYDLHNLRKVALENVQSLTFESNSLDWVGYRDPNVNDLERFDLSIPSVKVIVKNSRISDIRSHAFVGRINEINFDRVEVGNIEAFAFSNLLQMESLNFKDVELKEVKPQAFKKFGVEFLTLDGVVTRHLPSRTFSDVTVYRDFIIRNCHFQALRSSTFIINSPAVFSVTNTHIQQLEGEAFLLSTSGDVLFKDNVFDEVLDHAFMGISPSSGSNGRIISFDTNTFGRLDPYSLEVQPQFQARVTGVNLNQSCDCESIVETLQKAEFFSEISCLDSEGRYVTVKEFKTDSCSVLSGYYNVLIVVCVVILVISVVGIIFYVYYVVVYKRQKYGCEKGGKPPLSLIVPDGRTYKETELHVIVEKADLLTTDL